MNVLGVQTGHDSTAAIVRDGQIVADAAEERFSRIKHDAGLPLAAIESCLEMAKLGLSDIDAVAAPTESELPGLNLGSRRRGRNGHGARRVRRS
jgi:predicted NodU family carbamoyl transferase